MWIFPKLNLFDELFANFEAKDCIIGSCILNPIKNKTTPIMKTTGVELKTNN